MTKKYVYASSFDDVANGYDDRFSKQPITKLLRGEIYRRMSQVVSPNSCILEIGCGTGEDATYFASIGHEVMATDPSHNMLNIVRKKGVDRSCVARLNTEIWDANFSAPSKVLENGPYDAVFSNFGALNCVSDLPALHTQLTQVVRPKGVLVFVIINRWCLLEVALNALLLNPRKVTQRFRKHSVAKLEDGSELRVNYHSVADIKATFSPEFYMESYSPLGVFFPPSELYGTFQKRPRLFRLAAFLDASIGKVWPFSRWGDHYAIVMRRT